MKTKMLSTVLVFVLCLPGCRHDGDGLTEVKPGLPTGMSIRLTMPHAPKTYAPVDPNASDAEIELKKVNVLIYQETSPGSSIFILEANELLNPADFDQVTGTTDTYELKPDKRIGTTTGRKKIYVAMNYDGDYPAFGNPLNSLPDLVYTLPAPGALSANGIAMFSSEEKESILVKEDDPQYNVNNSISVTVKRMVAKITVQEHADLRNPSGDVVCMGGKMTNLQFALGNINKTTYLLQKTTGTAPDILVQDNNWTTFAATDFTDITDFSGTSTSYKAVDVATATPISANATYVPENTAQQYQSDGANLTYVSVRAQFTPAYFVDATGQRKTPDPTTPVTFWTVTWLGRIYYFNDVIEATAFRNANPGSVLSPQYEAGRCYYRIYMNTKATPDATITGSKANKFDVLRNSYYNMSIKSINSPGQPTNVGEVTEETSLLVDITILPWQPVAEEYEL